MKHIVYMLISLHKKKFYTYVGYTVNLSKRLSQHNLSKGAKYTRGKQWKIIYKKNYMNKSLALINEYKLKKDKMLRSKIKYKYISKNYENFNFITL